MLGYSYINLDRQVRALGVTADQVCGYNTDCVKLRGDYNAAAVKPKDECAPGEYHVEAKEITVYGPAPADWPTRVPFTFAERPPTRMLPESELVAHIVAGGSAVVSGVAGAGKTELARLAVEALGDDEGVIGTAVSNKACENLKERGVPNVKILTLLLVNQVTQKMEMDALKDVKLCIIDEASMVPPAVMAVIARAKRAFGFAVLLMGDKNQTTAICDAPIDYVNNAVFMEFVGGVHCVCEYKGFAFPDKARYTPALYHVLGDFLRTGVIPAALRREEAPPWCWRHLTFTNACRTRINELCIDRWAADRRVKLVNIGKLRVAPGLELMCYHGTDRENDVYKTNVVTVKAVDVAKKQLTLGGAVMEWAKVCELYDYAFATTIHKYQGGKIAEPYVIHEAANPHMNRQLMYTAMSRATRLEDVHIADADWGRWYASFRYRPCTTLAVKRPTREKCTVYRISFPDGSTYIGRTAGTLEERLAQHYANPTSDVMGAALAGGGATIAPVQEFTHTKKRTAEMIETELIAREVEAGGVVLNGRQLPPKKRAAEPTTRAGTKKVIMPSENVSKKRFEVRWRSARIPTEHQVKRFSYITDPREVALGAAEAWAAELVKLYT